jgi:hypothetical protein
MSRLLGKLRGILGMGLTWGVAWAAIFGALGLIVSVVDPGSIDPGERPLQIAAFGGVFGFISGAAFGLLYSFAEARKKILELSPARAAIWGAIGSISLPLLSSNTSQVILFAPIGAALAEGAVAIARRAERQTMLSDGEQLTAIAGEVAMANGLWTRSTEHDEPVNRDPRL